MDIKLRSDGDLDAGYGDGNGCDGGVEPKDDCSYGMGSGFGGGNFNNYTFARKCGYGRGNACGGGYADGRGKG